MAGVKAKVVFQYEAEQNDELTLSVGDIITNVDIQDQGWWEGEVKGKRGVFPENFVEVIKEDPLIVAKAASLPRATVLFDYAAEEPDELDLQAGVIIELLKQDEEGWWEGKFNGKIGMFPSNFVELIEDKKTTSEDTPVPKSPAMEQKPEMLIDFNAPEPADKNLPIRPPAGTPPVEEDTDVNKPKQAMGRGFGISNPEELKKKLRPVSAIVEEPKKPPAKEEPTCKLVAPKDDNKPMQRVPPLGKVEEGHPSLKKTESFGSSSNIKRPAPAPPKEPVATIGEKYIVKFPYEPENEDEICLKTGEAVLVIDKDVCEGWWQGTVDGKTGVFPNNFVEPAPVMVEDPLEEAPKDKGKGIGNSIIALPPKKKPLLPAGKTPALPARGPKEEAIEPEHKALPPRTTKPTLPELKKTVPPEVTKPVPPAPNKLVQKKPPPPVVKNKPGQLKPVIVGREPKKVDEDSKTGSVRTALNPPHVDRPRISSVGRKPPVRPVQVKELVPPSDPKEEEVPVNLDLVSSADLLANPIKTRVKGPGKTLPAKYTNKKDDEKDISEEQTRPAPAITSAATSDRASSVSKEIVEDFKHELSSVRDKMAEMEKRFMKHIKVLTNDLDSEKKERASLQIEIDRLKKKFDILEGL